MENGQGVVGKIITFILIVGILLGAIGFLAYYTDGFTEDVNTFSVECDGRQVMNSANNFKASVEEPMTVKVKYTFSDEKGYSVKVVPNSLAGKDFGFKVDGQDYSYQAQKDLTDGFIIEYGEESFTIKPKGNLTGILQSIYPNSIVEDCSRHSYENMFGLIVYSHDQQSSVRLNFSVLEKVMGVQLDKEEIIF